MKSKKRLESGFILINKPSGPTSHDIINQLRKITGIKKIGHAGTLDPMASGLLIVAIGRESTKKISQFVKLDKKYVATINLSANTDTYDGEGKVIENFEKIKINKKEINIILKSFLGEQDQVPPIFSAKKINGKKMYKLARAGIDIKLNPSRINIFKIKILDYSWPKLKIAVKCSSGTYIRSLGYDIGRKIGVGGYLEKLKRISINKYNVKTAKDIYKITKNNWNKYLFLPSFETKKDMV